jgi:hypothetical protein
MPFNSVNKQEYDELKRLLSQFKYITVRDEWTKQMVQYFLGNIDIPVTPDPVFSFNQNTYLPVPSKQEVLHKYNLPDKYVLVSFRLKNISNDYIEKMAGIIESNGYTPVGFPMPEGMNKYKIKQNIYNPLSPLDWYYLIKYADGYIGERMHPILVALHNGVPFFCFDEYGTQKTIIPLIYRKYIPRSSKIYHILSEANLLKNMVSYNRMCRKIDPEIVVNKLFNFNREQMQQFANFYQDYYERSMVKLLEYFHTNI